MSFGVTGGYKKFWYWTLKISEKKIPKKIHEIPCAELKGVGNHLAQRLQKIHIYTIQDLLFHLPYRYQDRTRITPIAHLKPGDYAVVEGEVVHVEVVFRRRRMLICYIQDASNILGLRFFHFNSTQQHNLQQAGLRLRCFGEVRWGKSGYEMIHPEYRSIHTTEPLPVSEHLTPLYPTTEGISQMTLRKLVSQALDFLDANSIEDYLPENIIRGIELPTLKDALSYVHRPPPDAPQTVLLEGQHPVQRRLALEELLAHQLSLARLKHSIQQLQAPVLSATSLLQEKFLASLPFTLTAAQQRVSGEIKSDLIQAKPMLRLVQGDVGSGKTVVAALAAIQALAEKYQVALMAPTEILSEQHYFNFKRWFEPLGIHVVWLAGKLSGKARQEVLQRIKTGVAQLVVGTHALFQDQVSFANLALLIIDEQHRFGVHQRLALREKGVSAKCCPHQLIMTATPIPRTLAMTAYADLDCSTIDELPPGRLPVNTIVLPSDRRDRIIARVAENCHEGKQAYWVCTLITESEALQCQAAEATAAYLRQTLPNLRIGLIHGQLMPVEKEGVMSAFKNHEIDLLVATTVIEVGVDVPNASLMIVENPERLGLAQLHQLRGRVGRGATQSHCVLLYQTPLSQQSKERLAIMRDIHDGFMIAQRDLELRGPGEVLGTKQTGLMQFKVADLLRDKDLLPEVQKLSQCLVAEFPHLVDPLIERWLGQREHYGQV